MSTKNQRSTIKKSFWGAAAFYFLIAFEFFYMAGPFAAYFYSVYAPALNFFNKSPILSWLNRFFLPHAVRETSSAIINAHELVGAILAIIGFLAFSIGACQVYYHKFAKKGIVTGGIYNFIRHPQYASFILCSFGLLILWPRYIVAIMFATMLFAYYLLAKVEEKECEEKFGQPYLDFKNRTAMFLPFKLPFSSKIPAMPKSKRKRIAVMLGLYLSVLLITIGAAEGFNILSLNSLYATYTSDSANVALSEVSDSKLEQILNIALLNEEVASKIKDTSEHHTTKYINYILPTEWFAAEVPMNGVKLTKGHYSPANYNKNLYKIIFTRAEIRGNQQVSGKEILTTVQRREPIVEVWVDLSEQKVIQILEIPDDIKYKGIPVAVY